ncbi:TonB-dependent receptor family protein [Sinomicrobium sp. M5D2P9]
MSKKLLLILFLVNTALYAQQSAVSPTDSVVALQEVVLNGNAILGSKFAAKNRTGSAYFISSEDLQQFSYTDISRVLQEVPGVNYYEEDGFGLRPNISLRGTDPGRSSKITIMEDGVLAAPAPYSAPAAYYFPTIARMQSVEILKGSSQVQYGPFTTGGAINMISTQIPESFSGRAEASYGTFNTSKVHASVGNSHQNIGYMVEYLNYRSDGFKELDNGDNTGFNKNDFVARVRINTDRDAKTYQSLGVKFQYSDETSDETYLGLTNADYKASPYRRYAASQKDQMNTDHRQIMVTHIIRPAQNINITTTGYYNGFARNWYKLDKVAGVSIAPLLEDPSANPYAYGVVTGTINTAAGELNVKNNNREYAAKGIQTVGNITWGNTVKSDLEIGARYHYDREDRFQWSDQYSMTGGIMQIVSSETPGTDANRISDATAFSAHTLYKLTIDRLTLTPGIRYENIKFVRKDYGKDNLSRTAPPSTRENKVDVLIPGIGANYIFNSDFALFGGIHKGFAPPGNTPDEDPEKSINIELGTRFSILGIGGEITGFYNNYSNMLGNDLAASGGSGTLEQFNAGKVDVKGLELLLHYDPLSGISRFKLPLSFTYTFTDTDFRNAFESNAWGEVKKGDEIPYISRHQFNARVSLEHEKFSIGINGRYNGTFRTQAGTGHIPENEKIDANFIVDMAAKYHLNRYLSLTGNINNLLDREYPVARTPSGLRPGLPFGAYGGVIARF